ncbi:MAG: hypothetical protein VB010_04585 [Sphaerochaeta associata]|uniref:hypothetical protein n=1 Tax=Sphaerochaeta associata TaxID=1129264 RepID=UPI002B1F3B07|nr:hypothetical protein [Sphaerochaeta associata]MEA5106611.1 hypothetical protein [Sphaerochaeta associata]
MKKTIAILLVLVIGMVGVWADTSPATSALTLTTEIGLIFQSKLVSTANKADTVDVTGFESLETLLPTQPVDPDTTSFGYLYIMSNNKPGYTLTITGEALTSTTTTSIINYTLTAGTATYVSSTNASTPLATSTITALDVDELAVSVDIVEADWNNALTGSYEADVTFSFTTNS